MRYKDVSVIILTHNRRPLLEKCVASLLAQTYDPKKFEIVIVDDGCTDNTHKYLRTLKKTALPLIRYFRQKHKGISAARNLGIKKSEGRLVAIVADDYTLDQNYVETIVRFFREHKEAKAVRFKMEAINQKSIIAKVKRLYYNYSIARIFIADKLLPPGSIELPSKVEKSMNLPAGGAAAFRKELFRKIGLFDENLSRVKTPIWGFG